MSTTRFCPVCQKQEPTLDAWTQHKHAHLAPLNPLPNMGASNNSVPRVGGEVNTLPVEGRVNDALLTTIFGMNNNILVIELMEPEPPAARAVPSAVPSDLFLLFNRRRAEVRQVVATFMTQHPRVKLSLGLQTVFTRDHTDGVQTIRDYARTPTQEIANVDEDLTQMFDASVHFLWSYIENFVRNGSNWVLGHYRSIILHVYALPPLAVGLWQRTPRELNKKGCIVNVRSDDNACFRWAILASVLFNSESNRWRKHQAQFPAYYETRASAWQHLDFTCITPGQLVTGHTVNLFEKDNPRYALNLFTYVNMDAELTYAMRPGALSDQEKRERKRLIRQFHVSQHVHNPARTLLNLLLLENPVTGEYHAVAITNLDTFFNLPHRGVKVCPKCLQKFVGGTKTYRQGAFIKHRDEFCGDPKYDRYNVNFPETHLSFTNSAYSMRLPFHIFADFETYGQVGKNLLNHDTSQRTIINRHQIMAYSLGVLTTPGVSDHLQSQFPPISYCGPNAEEHFVADFTTLKNRIQATVERMRQKHKHLKPVDEFTPEERALAKANNCHICGGEITNHSRHWSRDKHLWEAFFEDNDALIIDDYSLPDNYWRGPRVVDHCHIR